MTFTTGNKALYGSLSGQYKELTLLVVYHQQE